MDGPIYYGMTESMRSQRLESQTAKFLNRLLESGVLETGITDHIILKSIYNAEFLLYDIKYFHVFNKIVAAGCVRKRIPEFPEIVRFKMDQVHSFLQGCLADALAKLSLNDDANVRPNERSAPRSQPSPEVTHSPARVGDTEDKVVSPTSSVVETKCCEFKSFVTNTVQNAVSHSLSNSASTSVKQQNSGFIDQRCGFKLNELSIKNQVALIEDKTSCVNCGEKFKTEDELKEHKETDEHLFRDLYQHCRKQGNTVKPPRAVSGEPEGILIHSKDGGEGRAVLNINLLLSEDDELLQKCVSSDIQLLVEYQPPTRQSRSLYLDRTFLMFGESNNITLREASAARQTVRRGKQIKRNLIITEKEVGSTDYVIVFKFLQENQNFQLEKVFFVMKKICVRVDNDVTKEEPGTIVVKKCEEQSIVQGREATQNAQILTEKDESQSAQVVTEKEEPKRLVTTVPKIVEQAEPPPKPKHNLRTVRKLEEYKLPENYARFFNLGFQIEEIPTSKILREKYYVLKTLLEGVNKENYNTFLSLMLFLEEHQVLCDLKTYSMQNTPLFRDKYNHKLITITVPGLAEDRPSVLKRDEIFITIPGSGTFLGYVHQVGHTTIHVGMGYRFMQNFVDNMRATVDFSFNRHCFKLQHRAIDLLMSNEQVTNVCFPEICGLYAKERQIDILKIQHQPHITDCMSNWLILHKRMADTPHLGICSVLKFTRHWRRLCYPPFIPAVKLKSWMNKLIADNPQQRQAVENIINGTSLPAPYLLFGPPGTGKTVTLVEAMKQIYFQCDSTRILATAPSNSASDLIAQRVMGTVPPSQILRLYSPSREWSMVPEDLRNCCNYQAKDCYFPSKAELMKYRIIVTTLICAGRLVTGGFPEGHFSHIFVDECGHGLEPQSLVSVAGLLDSKHNHGQLVLSGDPKQLGPIIRSPIAKKLGLSQSLLERLMESCELYKKDDNGYNPKVLTKLVKNFRSHPDILKVPNELFYDNDLEPCGDMGVTYSACQWEELPTKGVPLIFHGVQGKDAQDDCSPSFYNIAEVDLVVKYVQKILNSKFCGQRLRPADIGIISPYRRQLTKLRRALERKRIDGSTEMTVGSVEEFQGQERRVIIVSTVRSDPAQLSLDRKFRLGFLREPKRFNVALTRAKSLLIVIGNPFILQTDPNWRRLLEWCIERGGYTGCKFSLQRFDPALQVSDPQHVTVKDKLEKQLLLTVEALSKLEDNKDTSNPEEGVDQLLERIKQINISSVPNISKLESLVSPPFFIMEQ